MDLGDRMKEYEEHYQTEIPRRMPVVMRLDGKCFHSLTKGCEKPFDAGLRSAILLGVRDLLEEAPARMAYQQSDEVSLLFIDYNRFDTQQWLGGNIQKMASVAAAIMSVGFSKAWAKPGYFDARLIAIPERDIVNYFIWRQQDCMRNAVSMASRTVFSAKQLHEKHGGERKAMLASKGVKFEDYDLGFRQGTVITKSEVMAAPVFSKDRSFLEKFLTVEEE